MAGPRPWQRADPHFDIAPSDGRLVVTHSLSRSGISDDLTGVIVDELFAPGWVRGSEMFERIFTGVVLSSAPRALAGWELFYGNTIQRLDELVGTSAAEAVPRDDRRVCAGVRPR